MRKTVVLFALAALLFSSSFTYAQSLPPILGTLPQKIDSLKKIYLELKVGMTPKEVLNLVKKHYPKLKLEDMDFWGPYEVRDYPGDPLSYWVIGMNPKMVRFGRFGAKMRGYKIILRIDFDEKMKLMNAVYTKFKRVGDADAEEREFLIGRRNY